MKTIKIIIFALIILAIPTSGSFLAADAGSGVAGQTLFAPAKGGKGIIPTFVITAVDQDNWVEIQTDNFPAKDNFIVTMGAMGSKGIGGIVVATTYSGGGDRFIMKYPIPASLIGYKQIAIRLESPGSGYFAYNWFYNTNINLPGYGKPLPAGVYTGYPTFDIVGVIKGDQVTIKGDNFPPSDSFKVRMNWMGTKGIAGTIVETVTTNKNGKFSNSTFDIPAFLANAYQVAIRLESPTTGYYAYNWFYNNTSSGSSGKGGAVPASYSGYPTFSISDVNADKNVTIKTNNLPPGDQFVVTMGVMGSKGVGGYWVDKFDSGKGGTQTLKFKIPAKLYGSYQIAIRIESPSTGYYAYNWFYNNTTGTGGKPPQPAPGYVGYPTFSISSVNKNDFVTIQGYNFPPNDTFKVRMNWMGTRGVAGTIVETVTTNANGKLSDTKYAIPAFLAGSYQIAIRLESPTSGYYAYNWFYNNNAP